MIKLYDSAAATANARGSPDVKTRYDRGNGGSEQGAAVQAETAAELPTAPRVVGLQGALEARAAVLQPPRE